MSYHPIITKLMEDIDDVHFKDRGQVFYILLYYQHECLMSNIENQIMIV